ncbi:squalene--hopene cyclase [Streptomyces marispadix]|uniref:Squalene--hopene cyclase n=1 Tax=Streptomyces marispadix TaxID=2922868 RepID=A0ABS9T4Z9_9ACTN|nr:squalene--hopene cyclase [Streptomyces marispadix]MCH6163609.1 squalene--hopene cyclase [Streptomyces marispadix]
MTATTDTGTGDTASAAPATSQAGGPEAGSLADRAARSAALAVEHLLARQDEAGWWKGDLETNVTMDAEDLLLREFLGVRDETTTREAARFVRSRQRDDGTWATFHGGPGDLSTTIEAYVALRLAGDAPHAPHMERASAWVREQGGVAASRVFTRIWLALFGWWRWSDLPEMPPEMIWFPKWFPLNIYDFGCWARQTIVPLTVVCAKRPVRAAPFSLDELHRDPARPNPPKSMAPAASWEGFFERLDRALHAYRRIGSRSLRRAALRSAARWIIERQENDGCWGGIQPPAVYSLIALRLLGYDLDHPVMRAGLDSLDRYTVRYRSAPGEGGDREAAGGTARMVEACQSPVWDTCLATIALADAGLPSDHPALVKAADWMLGEQVLRSGDWSVRKPQLPPGGWAFEFHNDNYPDADDTAEVVLALRRVRHHDQVRVDTAVRRAVRWSLGMQSRNGAWGAFDADNDSPFPNRLPFCDFGEVIDPPSADVTAHMVEMLCAEGRRDDPRVRRAVSWLLSEQEAGGAWFGRWGVNYVYGTGSVVPALVAAGLPASHPAVRRAVGWLESVQNGDGGWGEDLRSYRPGHEQEWAGRGTSTASQTAWALMALLAAGERESMAVEQGVSWLARTQREDGSWDEPHFTGTGFPWDFSINYHLYRQVFPLTALGRYLHGTGTGTREER